MTEVLSKIDEHHTGEHQSDAYILQGVDTAGWIAEKSPALYGGSAH
jgi:hypothetical protein